MLESKLITTENDLRALEEAILPSESFHDEVPEEREFLIYRRLWSINQSIIIGIREQSRRPSQGHYCGYAACVPLRNEFLQNIISKLKKSRLSLRANLRPEFILSENEATIRTYSEGNALFLGMHVCDNRNIDFSTISAQLFLKLEERLKDLRVRLVITEAWNPQYKKICSSVGCRTLYRTNYDADVFYFDLGMLAECQSLGTTLGEKMLHLWGMPQVATLNLSKTKRMIARLLVEGITEKCLADELKGRYGVEMSPWTAMDHVKQVRNRFRQVFPEKTGTKDLICYLTHNRFEIFEPKSPSELTLLSSSGAPPEIRGPTLSPPNH